MAGGFYDNGYDPRRAAMSQLMGSLMGLGNAPQQPTNASVGLWNQYQSATDPGVKEALIRQMQAQDQGKAFNEQMRQAGYVMGGGQDGGAFNYTAAPQLWNQYQSSTDQSVKDALIRQMQGADQGAAYNQAMRNAGYNVNALGSGQFGYSPATPPASQPGTSKGGTGSGGRMGWGQGPNWGWGGGGQPMGTREEQWARGTTGSPYGPGMGQGGWSGGWGQYSPNDFSYRPGFRPGIMPYEGWGGWQ